jgi:ATP phosphoribosyltransferase
MLTNGKLKIAIQKKGRLFDDSVELLQAIGLEFDAKSRQLFSLCKNLPIEIIFLRDDDIPEYVQDGVCQLGIVGQNEVSERSANVVETRRLGFSQCRLSIAAPEGRSYASARDLEGSRIATSYPTVLQNFLTEKGISASAVEISGSVEICPALGVSDFICDLVSTGTTLKNNRLVEVDEVMKSEAVIIQTTTALLPEKQALVNKLLARVDAYLTARDSKYLMLNIKKTSLDAAVAILPSLNTPTILPLSDPSMVSLHSVIQKRDAWNLAEQLQAAGAEGILISDIEKVLI